MCTLFLTHLRINLVCRIDIYNSCVNIMNLALNGVDEIMVCKKVCGVHSCLSKGFSGRREVSQFFYHCVPNYTVFK